MGDKVPYNVIRHGKSRKGVRCDNFLRSLGTKFKVVTEGNLVRFGVIRHGEFGVIRYDEMWQHVVNFNGVRALKLSLRLIFYQTWR